MELVKGHSMILALGGSVIAASRECSISVEREAVEIAGSSAIAKEFVVGRYTFTITTSGLYAITASGKVASTDLLAMLIDGSKVAVAYQVYDDAKSVCKTITCNAYVTSIEYSGSYQERATYSLTLQGTGDITQTSATTSLQSFSVGIYSRSDTDQEDYYLVAKATTADETVTCWDSDDDWSNGFINGSAVISLVDGTTATVDVDKVEEVNSAASYSKNSMGYFEPDSTPAEGDLWDYKAYFHYNGKEYTETFSVNYSED